MSEEFNNEEFNSGEVTNTGEDQPKGFAIASLVCGIISIPFCCVTWVSLVCGILGIVFSIVQKNKYGEHKLAKAGMICGIVGLVLAVLVWVLALLGIAALGTALGELS
ncbi:MAG: DUF4190 domain-containing protein [Lachnospiraceae bacterium]|nr:DUF4190 domain-containing protein [Lachnospiraceae bacterium]